jgi:hypothetical protein
VGARRRARTDAAIKTNNEAMAMDGRSGVQGGAGGAPHGEESHGTVRSRRIPGRPRQPRSGQLCIDRKFLSLGARTGRMLMQPIQYRHRGRLREEFHRIEA